MPLRKRTDSTLRFGGSMARENSREVDDLARDIVRNPHFRSALSESVARRRAPPSREEEPQRQSVTVEQRSRLSSTSPNQDSGRFESANQELSFLFQRGRRTCRPSDRSDDSMAGSQRPFWQTQQTSRSRSRRSTTFSRKPSSSSCAKEVVLLPDPSWDYVIRQSTKARLTQDEYGLNAFLVDKQWSARELYRALEQAFLTKLKVSPSLEPDSEDHICR